MTLAGLQRDFCSALRQEPAPLRARLVERAPPEADHAGLEVYRNAYRLRLRDCLRETYEKTWAWLGDASFDAAIDQYIDEIRSGSWTLADYGDGFSAALASLLPEAPEAAELAALEWAMRRAFDGPDAPPLSAADAAAADWESLVLSFAPTLTLVPVKTNCGAIWAAIAEGVAPPPAALLPEPAALCVWRKQLSPVYRTVAGQELTALGLALTGIPFASVCNEINNCGDDDTVIAVVGQALARWLQDELLIMPHGAAHERSTNCEL